MKTIVLLSLIAFAIPDDTFKTLVQPGAKVEKLAGGFRFTEGPASDAQGNIYFTDIPNNRIHTWSVKGELDTFFEGSGGSNGLMFDKEGNLLACQHSGRGLFSISPSGKVSALANSFNGKKLNSPNDLWIDPKGGVYFTDPRYGNRDNMEQDGEHVYYLLPDRSTLIRVVDDLVRPNGIMGTPDGKYLYVADNADGKTFRYIIKKDGSLGDKTLFIQSGSDGLTLDEHGNLYLTTDAVYIYSPKGKLLGSIEIPERPANVTFGGKDKKTLFITARTSIYSIKMKVGPAH